jgi:hypothetical protein
MDGSVLLLLLVVDRYGEHMPVGSSDQSRMMRLIALSCHTGASRYPDNAKNTGFRIK